MRIDGSSILMAGESSVYKSYTREESLRTWVGDQRPGFENNNSAAMQPSGAQSDFVELSGRAKAILAQDKGAPPVAGAKKTKVCAISEKDKQKLLVIQKMIEALTGKKIRFYVLEEIELDDSGGTGGFEEPAAQAPQGPRRQGRGLEYDFHETRLEQEKMSFTDQGIIKTADGKEINFSVQLSMSREFAARQDIAIRAGDAVAVDPLVINFSGTAAGLTSRKFIFDLNTDGKDEQISFVNSGSGFLALDLNGDGVVNNGSELFGPSTGDGFAELSQYDEDGNQWIDENDSIYDRLRIWTKDEGGGDVLFALGQKGVGAIFLGNIDTPFAIKNQDNDLQGQVNKSGIYAGENGTVGTVQQIDLAV